MSELPPSGPLGFMYKIFSDRPLLITLSILISILFPYAIIGLEKAERYGYLDTPHIVQSAKIYEAVLYNQALAIGSFHGLNAICNNMATRPSEKELCSVAKRTAFKVIVDQMKELEELKNEANK
jgi:hypothetical protein